MIDFKRPPGKLLFVPGIIDDEDTAVVVLPGKDLIPIPDEVELLGGILLLLSVDICFARLIDNGEEEWRFIIPVAEG